jgi:dihydrolipoamide dehydrogenase
MLKGLEGLIAAYPITLIKGFGSFISPREIRIAGEQIEIIEADRVIIATGSEPRNLPALPFDNERIHDSTSLLNLTDLPKKMIVIGGGVIGCEFASLFATLGVEITILELLPSLIPMEAKEAADALTKAFNKRGILIETGVKVEKVEKDESGIRVHVEGGTVFSADCCLVSIGRKLNTQGIGLEKAGVLVQENGMISVDEKMETNVDGIYAVGDIASKWWLAHVATHQGLIAADNACGKQAAMHYNAIPSVIYTHPEIATVGLSLDEAKKQGLQAIAAPFPFQALGKSQAALQTEGFAQMVVEGKTGQILGAQVVGAEASVLIAEITLAIANELTVECISETIHAHPTLSEAWLESSLLAEGLPLHLPPKRKRA